MQELRELCTAAGLEGARTYLQTGNVLFESKQPAEEVAQALESAFIGAGLRNAAAIVRSRTQLERLLAADPLSKFPAPDYMRYVALVRGPVEGDTAAALASRFPSVRVFEGAVCSAFTASQLDRADVNGYLEKTLKVQATTRYWHVVEEIARMLRGAAS
jgi:uncharacterized protein (DUF1697 family)